MNSNSYTSNKWALSTGVFLILGIVFYLFINAVQYMASGFERLEKENLVHEITKGHLSTKIHFGASPYCDKKECWLQESFDDSIWLSTTLPSDDFKKFEDYKNSNTVYYRLKVKLPKNLKQSKNSLALSLGWVLLKDFSVYMEGQPIFSGEGFNLTSSFTQIAIPKKYVKDTMILVLKANYDINDLGIKHRERILLGPKFKIMEQKVLSDRMVLTARLMWVLPLGTIFFLFSILFIFIKDKSSYLSALVFTLCALVTQIFKSDFEILMSIPFTAIVGIFLFFQVTGIFSLFRFFTQFYKIHIKDKQIFLLWGVSQLIVAGFVYGFHTGNPLITIPFLSKFILTLYALVIFSSLLIGSRKVQDSGARGKKSFTLFLSGYLVLVLYFLFTQFNYTWDPILDFIVCLFIALVSIFEFGVNEKIIEKQAIQIKEQATDVAIGQTAAMMAHDIRKPFTQLSTIVGQFDEFASNKELLSNAKTELNSTLSSVETMLSEVMDYSRKANLELSPTSINEVLKMSLTILKEPKDCNIEIFQDLKGKHKPLAEPERLTRVLSNILANAIDAISVMGKKSEGIITIRTYEDDHFNIEIENDGPLIPEEHLEHLFESFYSKGKTTGTGLGLASCRKTIELHQGTISAINKDHSVVFKITLKKSEEEETNIVKLPELKKKVQTSSSSTRSIYICDDSMIMLTFLKTSIQNIADDCEIKTFRSGEEVLVNVKSDQPSIIFTDLNLEEGGGKINGYDVIREVKKLSQDTQCFLISNTPLSETKSMMEELGAKALQLPISDEVLKDIL